MPNTKETTTQQTGDRFEQILLTALQESPLNPRKRFNESRIKELADSIRAHGIIEPLVARDAGDQFEIVAGARRFRAAKLVAADNGGPDHYAVPCIVKQLTDAEVMEVMVIENGQRADVHFIEEAEGFAKLIDLAKYSPADVAKKIGKDEGYVRRRLILNKLVPAGREMAYQNPHFSFVHAMAVARLLPADQKSVIDWCGRFTNSDFPTAAKLNAMIHSQVLLDLSSAPFPIVDAKLVKKAGACPDCTKRSGAAPALFPEIANGDKCLDHECFAAKRDAYIAQKSKALEKKGLTLVPITDSYYAADKSTLRNGQYVLQTAGQPPCEFAEEAVYTEGKQEGRIVQICRSKECEIHTPQQHTVSGGYQKYETPAADKLKEKQRELATAIDRYYPRALAAEIYAAVSKLPSITLPLADLRLIAHTMFEGFDHEHRKEIARDVFKFEPVRPPKTQGITPMPDWDAPVEQAIEKWQTQDVLGFCLALAGDHFKHSHDARTSYNFRHFSKDHKGPTVLEQLAKRYKIQPDSIKKKVTAIKKAEFSGRIGRLEKRIAKEETAPAKPKAKKHAK